MKKLLLFNCFVSLKESAPEPASPGLTRDLQTVRKEGRHFVQCLQRPKDIVLYTPDKNIRAELRPYQQVGCRLTFGRIRLNFWFTKLINLFVCFFIGRRKLAAFSEAVRT